ncbi:MAG TPA: hypothetical protein VEF90_00550 [Xanthobacteraceae bacterium]|nr:hypothetical protein [Xanthobacteraceae bacterium]
MSTKTVKYSTVAVAAALAMAALVAAAAPAFAWLADPITQGSGYFDSAPDYNYAPGYYNYAPGYHDQTAGAVANHGRRPAAHRPAVQAR